jgi:hypothetical protein
LIAGFTATDVGRGAICITCHNTRRGLRNDAVFADYAGTSESVRAPHGGAQGDVLMGQNAYLVAVGNRGSHAMTVNVEDTCVTCHMEATPPPDILSYNQGGTNHTFFPRTDICGECHGFEDASLLQSGVAAELATLGDMIESAWRDVIAQQIAAGNSVNLGGGNVITNVASVAEIQFGESRGRQAITVTFTDDTVVGPVGLNSISAGGVAIYQVADPNLLKAGWNWNLVNNDHSLGVHNPEFVAAVLDAAIAVL